MVYYSTDSTSIFLDEISTIDYSITWWEAMEVWSGVVDFKTEFQPSSCKLNFLNWVFKNLYSLERYTDIITSNSVIIYVTTIRCSIL